LPFSGASSAGADDLVPLVIHPLFDAAGHRFVTDEALVDVWRRIVAENKVEMVFYSGGVNTPAEFFEFILQPRLLVSLVVDEATGRPRALGWLTNAGEGSAFAHYCVLGPFQRSVGRAMLAHWCGLKDAGGAPMLDILLGITPEVHTAALRLARIMGFSTIGTIPRYCRCPYAGGRCGGVLSCFENPHGPSSSESDPDRAG
jgi:hypothetical protein